MIPLYRTDPYLFTHTTVVDNVVEEGDYQFIICRELIFTEGGGQPADYGTLTCNGETRDVLELIKHKGDVRLRIETIIGVSKGNTVICDLNVERRRSIMKLHTAQHALAGAVRRLCGSYQSYGMSINQEATRCSMKFDLSEEVTSSFVESAIKIILDAQARDASVRTEIFGSAEAAKLAFGEIYRASDPGVQLKGKARVVIIEGLDVNACGGTHVKTLREVGAIKLADIRVDEERRKVVEFSLF